MIEINTKWPLVHGKILLQIKYFDIDTGHFSIDIEFEALVVYPHCHPDLHELRILNVNTTVVIMS